MLIKQILKLVTILFSYQSHQFVCSISEYVKDPFNATAGIQAALDACGTCGGMVLFDVPFAKYTSGALIASGSLMIHIPKGVTLYASPHHQHYPGPQASWYLLSFQNCTKCAITGGGTLDGQARLWVNGSTPGRKTVRNFAHHSCSKPEECRPRLLGVVDSHGVVVHDLYLRDPIYWALHVVGSESVSIHKVSIQGDWDIPNNDGIDVDSSVDVAISESIIDTADDAICIKTTRPGVPTTRITVENCTLRSRSAAVKIGSESLGDMAHLVFRNLLITECHRGLAVQVRDGSDVRNVLFSNIKILKCRYTHPSWWGAAEAVYITAQARQRGGSVGQVQGLEVAHVAVESSENGIFIFGDSDARIRDVAIRNFTLHMRNVTGWPGGAQDYRPGWKGLVESRGTAAIWVENSEHIIFEDVHAVYHSPRRRDWIEEVHIDDATTKNVALRGCTFTNSSIAIGWRDENELGAGRMY